MATVINNQPMAYKASRPGWLGQQNQNSYFKPLNPEMEAATSMRLINEQGQNALDRYTSGVTADMNNALTQGYQTVRQQMADQGLLSSTAAGTAMGRQYQQVSSPFLQSIAGARTEYQNNQRTAGDQAALMYQELMRGAREEGRTDRSFSEMVRQFGVTQGMALWELLQSGALAKEQLQGNNKGVRYPKDPKMFSDIFSQRYLPPKASTGPTGDPKEQYPRYSEPFRKTLAGMTEDRVAADADADRALSERRLALDAEQQRWAQANYRPEADPNDPENTRRLAFQTLYDWRQNRFNPDTGMADPNSPTAEDMAAIIQGAFGIDPMTDPQMLAILGIRPQPTAPPTPAWMTRHTAAPTGTTNRLTRGLTRYLTDVPIGIAKAWKWLSEPVPR